MCKKTCIGLGSFLALIPASAGAQLLGSVLPDDIPGYSQPFGMQPNHALARPQPTGLQLGGVSATPAFMLSKGYDSAPNGAAPSSVTSAVPSLLVRDDILGFGAFAAANLDQFPQDSAQNTSGITLAAGERAMLPDERITLSAGYLATQETGFALDTVAITRPLWFNLRDVRASDVLTAGMFSLTPKISATFYHFPGAGRQDQNIRNEQLTTAYLPGGPIQLLLRLQAGQTRDQQAQLNTQTNEVLAGLVDTANGLWRVSLLAGIAQRQASLGGTSAPVAQARLDWMPTELDELHLTLAREVTDPNQLSTVGYTLTEAEFSARHSFPARITLKFTADVSHAHYDQSPLCETLVTSDANLAWPLNRNLAVSAEYIFRDRQANYLRAANEHVFTLGLTWSP